MAALAINPIIWEDLPDPEVLRVGNVYYMSCSSFHFSPGAPLFKSYDLVTWEQIGNSVPELPPPDRFMLDGHGPTSYGKGVWASTLKYRKSNGLFYFYAPIQGTDKTYVWTSDTLETWTPQRPIEKFYYDLGVFVDDDDTMYMAYGTKRIEVAQLTPDGCGHVESKVVHDADDWPEGARMYKIRGAYYIWLTMRGVAQRVLKSTSGPFGPYEARDVIDQMDAGILGAGHPHQGGLVDTPEGDWYYMAFTDVFPVGRAPILAPVTFDDEGWPTVVTNNGAWPSATKFPRQSAAPSHAAKTTIGNYSFDESKLDHRFAWNHNPDNSKWRIESGHLVLQTGTVTNSLHAATNTLTLRTVGPGSIATVCLDVSGMRAGDRAGLCMLRDESAYIGIHAGADGRRTIAYVDDIEDGPKDGPDSVPVGFMNGRPVALDWKSYSVGTVGAETALRAEGSKVWLRVRADLRPRFVEPCIGEARLAVFEYSVDGQVFMQLGPAHALTKSYHGFVGHRFGVFNFATGALGGEVLVSEVEVAVWEPTEGSETVAG